jgi:preprotein translocase subunit SecD
LISAPSVTTQITGQDVQIENVTTEQADTIVAVIKGGALPVPVTVDSLTLD